MDNLTSEQRSLNMSRIRGRDTKPELQLRKGLHALGYRFRLHVPDIPGRPDLVFPRYSAVIQVNGCFWHGHDCHLFRMPTSRREFWAAKIAANKERDKRTNLALANEGWRVLTVWECALKGVKRQQLSEVLDSCGRFLRDDAADAAVISAL